MRIILCSIFIWMYSQCCHAQHWDSLGLGLDNYPRSFMVDSVTGKLFVGGHFTYVDSMSIWGIASWNGVDWDSLGSGIDKFPQGPGAPGAIRSITRFGNYIYVGGAFRRAGNVLNTYAFARWDGNQWGAVPGATMTFGNTVAHIVDQNGELYICGAFDSVSSLPANCLAKWDGTTWQTVGNNYNFQIQGGWLDKIQFYNGNLYVAGNFEDPQGNTCRLAKWDGSAWQFFTNELSGSVADVWDMEVYNGELYVAGLFFTASGNVANSIMRWNDQTWRDVAGSVQILSNPNPTVKDMCVHNGELYCVGNFEKIGGVPALGLAKWDGNAWCGFGTQFLTYFQQMTGATHIEFYTDTMYVGGSFWYADSVVANNIVKWISGSFTDTCGVLSSIGDYSSTAPYVYPNPTGDIVTFQFENDHQSREIGIYDQFGREILREKTDESSFNVLVQEFSEGIYVYSIVEENGSALHGKFVVQ